MDSEADWMPPKFVDSYRNPELAREWAARVAAWESENQELWKCWREALVEDDERSSARLKALRLQEAQDRLPDVLQGAGMPVRCSEWVSGKSLQETHALLAVRAFACSAQTFCLLLGAAGAGKSVAASWMLKSQVWNILEASPSKTSGFGVAFVRASDMARMSAYGDEAQEKFGWYCRARTVVLDDLGTERPSDIWLALLDEFIDRRYGDKLQTILTTNLDADSFKKRYGERISDRIRHDGMIVGAGAESLRTPPRKAP